MNRARWDEKYGIIESSLFVLLFQVELERLNNASHEINLLEKDHEVSASRNRTKIFKCKSTLRMYVTLLFIPCICFHMKRTQ